MNFSQEYEDCRRRVEEELSACFMEGCAQGELLEAMRYSLLSGGKRIRPVLVLKSCEACGGTMETAMPAALGIEMLHTYSLIHDDLPCMDNDSLRRGKPTCHIVYGETTAVLAGDALQAAAFATLLEASGNSLAAARAAAELATAASEKGMCGGQYLDTVGTGTLPDEEELCRIHALKTGALLKAACRMGGCFADADENRMAALTAYAEALGMAFQIRDDILDAVSTREELGKDIGSDEKNGKITFYSLKGLKDCEAAVKAYTETAVAAVEHSLPKPDFLIALAWELALRNH